MLKIANRGFTLLEMVMVIVILGIIGAIGSVFLSQELTTYFNNQTLRQSSSQVRYAMESMVRRLRQINLPTSMTITTASPQQLEFTDINGNTITYSQSGTNLVFTYTHNGTAFSGNLLTGLATGTGLQFNYLNSSGIALASPPTPAQISYITITLAIAQKNINYSVRTTVFLRSLLTS